MNLRTYALASALCAPLAVAACSAPSAPEGSESTAEASAALGVVPSDVACVRIGVRGSRTVTTSFDVTAGQSPVLHMASLPVGAVKVTSQAFPTACAAVTTTTAPTWMSDPLAATLQADAVAPLALVLRPATAADFTIDFESDGGSAADAGAADAAPAQDAAPPGTVTSVAQLDFGSVDCGTTAAPQSLPLTNLSAVSVPWQASVTQGSFTLSKASGTLAPFASDTIVVTPAAIGGTASTAANAFGGSVSITGVATPLTVPLRMTAQGAVLTTSTPTVFLGPTSLGTAVTGFATLTNSGNAAIILGNTATFTGTALEPPFLPEQEEQITAGGTTNVLIGFDPQQPIQAGSAIAGTLSFFVLSSTALCAPLPTVALHGTVSVH